MSAPAWERLGRPAPRDLVDARRALHHAAQIAASVGKTLLEPQADDSHPNLGWDPAARALAGHRVPGARPFQAALRPADLTLLLLDAKGGTADALPLAGRKAAEAYTWLARAIEARFGRRLPSGLTPPGYELPAHPVAGGAAFASEPTEAFAEVGRWLGNADLALRDLAGRTPGASDVRCWPHHFDIATLLAVETADDGSASKTIGLGLSPGDELYPQPYWYVTPWPYPDPSVALPELPEGASWHREGYTAAILTGDALVAGGPAPEQAARARAFLERALAASRRVHGV